MPTPADNIRRHVYRDSFGCMVTYQRQKGGEDVLGCVVVHKNIKGDRIGPATVTWTGAGIVTPDEAATFALMIADAAVEARNIEAGRLPEATG